MGDGASSWDLRGPVRILEEDIVPFGVRGVVSMSTLCLPEEGGRAGDWECSLMPRLSI